MADEHPKVPRRLFTPKSKEDARRERQARWEMNEIIRQAEQAVYVRKNGYGEYR